MYIQLHYHYYYYYIIQLRKLLRLSCLRFLTISNLIRLCNPFKILNSLFTYQNSDPCSYKNCVILFTAFSASFRLTFSIIGIDSFSSTTISPSLSALNIASIISSSVSAPSGISSSILIYSRALRWLPSGRRAINFSSSTSSSSILKKK
jgi:hypothetical protein